MNGETIIRGAARRIDEQLDGILPLGVVNEEVEQTLMRSLEEDPYFEVRAAAARVLGELGAPEPELEKALAAALDDAAPAVVAQSIRALGKIGQNPELVGRLQEFYLHGNWHFRQEVVGALHKWVERGVLDADLATAQLERILATSPFFQPRFPLNEKLSELAELLQRTKELRDCE